MASPTLQPAEGIDITILVDNYIDSTLQSSPGVSRFRDRGIRESIIAEHGLSLFIEITGNEGTSCFLLDTGASDHVIAYNAKRLGLELKKLSGIFISHNHSDHTSGLETVLYEAGPLPVYMHPYGFYTKWVKSRMNRIDKDRLALLGAIWKTEEGPQLMSPCLMTTGPISATTGFEEIIGLSERKVEINGVMETERFLDDGALIGRIRDRGLVVITGCAHSGIINTIEHCQKLAGGEDIFAVVGGFHLTQASKERIEATIGVLRRKKIRYIVPLHCTGFEAMASMWHDLPESFVVPSVGTRIEL